MVLLTLRESYRPSLTNLLWAGVQACCRDWGLLAVSLTQGVSGEAESNTVFEHLFGSLSVDLSPGSTFRGAQQQDAELACATSHLPTVRIRRSKGRNQTLPPLSVAVE